MPVRVVNMAEDGLQLFGGDWTERKLEALDKYLRAYARALSKTKFKRVYIDAFAGTGYREQKVSALEILPSIFEEDLKGTDCGGTAALLGRFSENRVEGRTTFPSLCIHRVR